MTNSNKITLDPYIYACVVEQWFRDKYGVEFDVYFHDYDDVADSFGIINVGTSCVENVLIFEIVDEKKYFLAKIAYGLEDQPYHDENIDENFPCLTQNTV